MITFSTNQNRPLTLADELGRGGEATVYAITGWPDSVAKLYHRPTDSRRAKLAAMLANPPTQPHQHTAIIWPTDLLFREGQFVGFVMPRVTESVPLFNAYNPLRRRAQFPSFTQRHLYRIALNLTRAVGAVHDKGYIIGDVNESNILVNRQSLVTLVDTDSFQVTDLTGEVHRCPVGKPEFTPPEMHGVPLSETTQRLEHDLFGVTVLLFQLLMQGVHPFMGVLNTDKSIERVDLYALQRGMFPYDGSSAMLPPPAAPPFTQLPPPLQDAFVRCFVEGHHQPYRRPTMAEWAHLLEAAEQSLVTCWRDRQHVYGKHLSRCPWCATEPSPQKPLRVSKKRFLQPSKQRFVIVSAIVLSIALAFVTMVVVLPSLPSVTTPTPINQSTLIDAANFESRTIQVSQLSRSIRLEAFAFAPDSRHLAVSGDEGYFVYDVETLQEVYFTETNPAYSVTYSPDGTTLAIGQFNGAIDVYWAESGEYRRTLTGHTERINHLAYSPDGTVLASASADGTVTLWAVSTGELRLTLTDHQEQVRAVAFSPDGQTFASAGYDKTVRLWRIAAADASDVEPLFTLTGPNSGILAVLFSADGQTVLASDFGREVSRWRVADGTALQPIEAQEGGIHHLNRHGDMLVFGTKAAVYLGSFNHEQPVHRLTQDGSELTVLAADGRWLASLGSLNDASLNLAQLSDLTATARLDLRHTLDGNTAHLTALDVSPDGETIAATGWDGLVRVWSLADRTLQEELRGSKSFVNALAYAPNGQAIAVGSLDNNLYLWSADDGDDPTPQVVMQTPFSIESIAFRQQNGTTLLISGDEAGQIRLWSSDGEALATWSAHTDAVTSLAVSTDGRQLVSGSEDERVKVWAIETGELLTTLTAADSGWVEAVAISPSGELIATVTEWDGLQIWQSNGDLLFADNHGSPESVAFSNDGQWLAGGYFGGGIRLWRVSDWERHYLLSGHTAAVTSLDFTPDDTRLTSASRDGTIRVWSLE